MNAYYTIAPQRSWPETGEPDGCGNACAQEHKPAAFRREQTTHPCFRMEQNCAVGGFDFAQADPEASSSQLILDRFTRLVRRLLLSGA
jgi:hypothetical protein